MTEELRKDLEELYATIGRVLYGIPEEYDEDYLYAIFNKLRD